MLAALGLVFFGGVAASARAEEANAAPGAGAGSALDVPDDLSPEADNQPVLPEVPAAGVRYDDDGFPEDPLGLLIVGMDDDGYTVSMRGISFPFLLYAQFANRQRDAVFIARDGLLQDTLPDGTFVDIPYGSGALKTTTAYISVVEGIILPHVSDNQKAYQPFPLRDLYLGASLGVTGLLAEVRFVDREQLFVCARAGWSIIGGLGGAWLAPLSYNGVRLHLGAGASFPGLLENLIGQNHWSIGGDLLLGLGDADRDPATPAAVWMPGVFFELEKRDLFGWGDGWAGFDPRGDFRDDPRPDNYHVRALSARVGVYVDFQNGASTGWLKMDAAIGLRYNVVGPRIPEHPFKETRVVYLSDQYREQILRQREQRKQRIDASEPSP